MKKIWKPIENFPLYKVSNKGDIISINKKENYASSNKSLF